MARPTKSAKVLTECSQTKAEINSRIQAEDKLKGAADSIFPPGHLNTNQKKIFSYIVKELQASKILGNLDIYILSACAIAIDRLQEIEKIINKDIERLMDKSLLSAKEKYSKEFFRCCNELSLSPQSRAKLGNINMQAEQEKVDPLLKALKRVK